MEEKNPPQFSNPFLETKTANPTSVSPPRPIPNFSSTPPPPNTPVSGSVSPSSKPSLPTHSPRSKIVLIVGAVAVLLFAFLLIFFLLKQKSLSLGFLSRLPVNKKQKITLTYWGLFEPPAVFQQIIDDYQKSHPDVQIKYVQENLKLYRERLQAALERNEGPDIFRLHQTWVPMLGNYLSPLPTSLASSLAFEKTFYPSAQQTLKYRGQYVAIPLMVDGLSLFYNEELFKARGKTPPATWGELKKTACDLTVKDEKGKIRIAGVALGTTNNVDHWSDILGLMIFQNGGDPANPTACTTLSEGQTTCFVKDALSFYTLFSSNRACLEEESAVGAVWSSLLPTSTYAFATGQVAMYFAPSWRVFDIQNINSQLKFKIVPVPQLPGNKVAWSSYWVEGVSKNSPHQKEAWDFLNYLVSKDVLQKLYQTESSLRLFGEPFSRVDMASLLQNQPYVGPFIEQAPFAKSWYLSSNTFDNGVNDKIIKYYEDAVNLLIQGNDSSSVFETVSKGVAQILNQYGLVR